MYETIEELMGAIYNQSIEETRQRQMEFANEGKRLWREMMLKENEGMSNTKTFQEVIRDIKRGEEWTHGDIRIAKRSDSIMINTDRFLEIGDNVEFELQRNKVSFTEAFAAYEQGKEIESRDYRYKKINNEDGFYLRSGDWDKCTLDFSIDEIRGIWYINE